MAQSFPLNLVHHAGLRQFTKFCIIGATSAVIDVGLLNILVSHHIDPIAARVCSFSIAVTNGFIWNSLWTFRGQGSGRKHEQFLKFVAINVIGLLLNLIIQTGVFYLLTGHKFDRNHPDRLHLNLAVFVAIPIVACWNFLAARKWTFT